MSGLNHKTNKSNKSGVSEAKLSKLRTQLFKDAAKGTTITTNNNNKSKSKDEPQRSIVEGVSVDQTPHGSRIPSIITDNQAIEGRRKNQYFNQLAMMA